MIHTQSYWQRGFNDCKADKPPNEPIKNEPAYCPENNGYRNGYFYAQQVRAKQEIAALRATETGDTHE